MSVFSYTAPTYTPEDEAREKESLGEEGLMEINDGIFGIDQTAERLIGHVETDKLKSNGVAELKREIDNIDHNEKEEYLEVLKHAPNLFESESNPIMFLRYHKYNPQAAARGLVEYWSLRKEIFGDDSFLLPMTLHGAMADYGSSLELGIFALVPDDRFGRRVFFFDRIKMLPEVIKLKTVLALSFYLHQKMIERSDAYKGYVKVINLRGFNLIKHSDRKAAKGLAKIVWRMPIDVKSVHLCSSAHSMTKVAFPVLKFILGKKIRLKFVTHHGHSGPEFAQVLAKYGLNKKNLFPVLGGTFQIDPDLTEWISSKESLEKKKVMQDNSREC
mmetsp:Transcript_12201/g.18722  ORF Transcript_12201/g.18722 Transcript_12201/m.18722 type:complete len:330 (-) Transcript_12201:192-1181(-)